MKVLMQSSVRSGNFRYSRTASTALIGDKPAHINPAGDTVLPSGRLISPAGSCARGIDFRYSLRDSFGRFKLGARLWRVCVFMGGKMKLAFSNYVYEVAKWPIEKTLASARRFGFTYTEIAPVGAVNLAEMSAERRREIVRMHKDHGLQCAQLLMLNVRPMVSPEASVRQKVLDYMKDCCEFQLELGGRQVLVCGGCGLLQIDIPWSQSWVNSIDTIRRLAEWGFDKGILVDLEIEPQVYFLLNSTDKAARMIEDIGQPNVFVNIDVGHFALNREPPTHIEKLRSRIIQVHLSDTGGLEHTNRILGTGCVDFRAYVSKMMELGIEQNCTRAGEPCVAGIELGDMGHSVDDPDRWVSESLNFLRTHLPEVPL